MQCSAELLQERIQAYCIKHNKDEAQLWQDINAKYLKKEERNVLWERDQEEYVENAQAFAQRNLVNEVITILDEWENIG